LGMLFPRPPSSAPASRPAATSGTRTIWVLRDGGAVAVDIQPGPSDGLVTVVSADVIGEGDLVITDTVTSQ